MGKRKRIAAALNLTEEKGHREEEEEGTGLPPGQRFSDENPPKRTKWINKERVLVLGSRGITHRDRHLMLNMREMLPHSKSEPKMDPKDALSEINEMAEIRNCGKCLFFENRKRKDLYLWLSNISRGPSIKFLVENVHTMEEMKMTGNCLKGSRPLLSFDPSFDKSPHFSLLKELLVQTFGTPNQHPKSQPFHDHVYTFTVLDHRIWFRHYQVLEEDGALAEIGPRFVLNPIKIFEGSFGGRVIYSNPHYISPNRHRRQLLEQAKDKYRDRVAAKHGREVREPGGDAYQDLDLFDHVFDSTRPEDAEGKAKNVFRRNKD
jgi:ribosome biogenesis protein BRX1